ncbi:MAG TPA: hypothetical protein VFO82_16570, partial [Steroidobacteraceae bacterium]|nr:hypothetical protein [Steroidobacteraceae bacterium]
DESSSDEVSLSFGYSATRNSGQGDTPSEAEQRQAAIDHARKFLAEIADPAGRARALEQHRAMMRVGTQGLADYLKLDPDEFARFIDLQAQHSLAQREIATRCMLDPKCMYRGPSDDLVAAQEREIASAFGADKIERYHYFMRSGNERQAVAELRGRLPDNARLSDAKADELVRVWVDESERIQQDMKRVGYGIATQNSMVYVVMDQDPDGARAAAAAEYNQRWRERAGTVLTPEQLAVYTQLQQEALDQSRAFETMRQTSN